MSLHQQLLRRAAEKRPIRVGLIGAGKFGSMYLAQIPRTPGVHLVAIADLSPDAARGNLARVGWSDERTRAPGIDQAVESGATHVGDDWRALVSHPAIDIVVECTGSPATIAQAITGSAPGSIVCLTGLGGAQHAATFDVATLNQSMVLENRVVFGTVNANLRHYHAAARALARADRAWLERVITRRVPLDEWREAYEKRDGDVKTVLVFED